MHIFQALQSKQILIKREKNVIVSPHALNDQICVSAFRDYVREQRCINIGPCDQQSCSFCVARIKIFVKSCAFFVENCAL